MMVCSAQRTLACEAGHAHLPALRLHHRCEALLPQTPLRSVISDRRDCRMRSTGKDAVQSWLDLAGFVTTAGASTHTPYEELADKFGKECYVDVAGWHLYLKDVKLGGQLSLAQGLAQQLGAQIEGQGYRETDVVALLGRVPIKLGQGKVTVALSELMPPRCVRDLTDACEEYARRR